MKLLDRILLKRKLLWREGDDDYKRAYIGQTFGFDRYYSIAVIRVIRMYDPIVERKIKHESS